MPSLSLVFCCAYRTTLVYSVCIKKLCRRGLYKDVYVALASKEVSEQYQLLECEFGTSFITQCLNDPENAHSFLQVVLISRDWEIVLEMAKYHQSTKHISDASSW